MPKSFHKRFGRLEIILAILAIFFILVAIAGMFMVVEDKYTKEDLAFNPENHSCIWSKSRYAENSARENALYCLKHNEPIPGWIKDNDVKWAYRQYREWLENLNRGNVDND